MKQKIIFLFFLVMANHLSAQVYTTTCYPGPLTVQIPKQVFDERTRLFKAPGGKQEVLTNALGSFQPASDTGYDLFEFFTNLTELLNKGDGIRIYFAAFATTGTAAADMPYVTGRENRLVPIFVPTKEDLTNPINNNVPNEFYIPDVIRKKGLRKIESGTARAWIKKYVSAISPEDTRALWYNNKDLKPWCDEMICQHRRINSNVDQIGLYWATYEQDYSFYTGVSNPIPTGIKPTKGLLTLLFQVPNAIVSTDSARQLAFRQQYTALKKKYTEKSKLATLSSHEKTLNKRRLKKMLLGGGGEYDTGVPCPPADNCIDP